MTETRYVYDAAGRLERSITTSPWTAEDRALMLAWRRYQNTIDERCQQPIEKAWHPKNDPVFYDVTTITCHACTAKARAVDPTAQPTTHHIVTDNRDYDELPLPPFRPEDFN